MNTPRALVTGAGGFVGRHVVEALLAAGWQVTALDRAFDADLSAEWSRFADRLSLRAGDAADLPTESMEAVVHASALTANPNELGLTPEAYVRAQLDPTLGVVEWAAERNARVILISSSAVYRESAPGPLAETVPPTPLGLYAVAKSTTEALAETLHAEYGRDIAAIRLSSIYGPGELPRTTRPRLSLVARLLAQAIETGTIHVFADDPARDWTYAPDVGRVVVALLAAPQLNHALYNVASGQVRSPRQIAEALAAALPDVEIDAVEGTDPALPPLTRFGVLSSERLSSDTGFADWTPFEDGVTATAQWAQARLEVA